MELSLGERIKKIRKTFGYNQKDFAKQLGISQTHISGIESNKEKPSLTIIKLISAKFCIDEEWIVSGIDPGFHFSPDNYNGIMKKYNEMKFLFEGGLELTENKMLYDIIDAYSNFVSCIAIAFKKNTGFNNNIYIENFAKITRLMDNLFFKVMLDIKPDKNNVDRWIQELNLYTEKIEEIKGLIKENVNIILDKFDGNKKI